MKKYNPIDEFNAQRARENNILLTLMRLCEEQVPYFLDAVEESKIPSLHFIIEAVWEKVDKFKKTEGIKIDPKIIEIFASMFEEDKNGN